VKDKKLDNWFLCKIVEKHYRLEESDTVHADVGITAPWEYDHVFSRGNTPLENVFSILLGCLRIARSEPDRAIRRQWLLSREDSLEFTHYAVVKTTYPMDLLTPFFSHCDRAVDLQYFRAPTEVREWLVSQIEPMESRQKWTRDSIASNIALLSRQQTCAALLRAALKSLTNYFEGERSPVFGHGNQDAIINRAYAMLEKKISQTQQFIKDRS
jgi:hypothetical protein